MSMSWMSAILARLLRVPCKLRLSSTIGLMLVDARHMRWQNRAHSFGVSAQLMRRILVDFGRRRHYLKREAFWVPDAQRGSGHVSSTDHNTWLALDDALNVLGPRTVKCACTGS